MPRDTNLFPPICAVIYIAAEYPFQLYPSDSLATVNLDCLIVSCMVIATLVQNRGEKLATIVALIGGIGAFCSGI
jgi:hypothetical protein